jgi:hypothetical protein
MAVAWMAAAASAATPTSNVPISQMPIATSLKTNAWIPIIQPLPGRTTNDNFRVSPTVFFAYPSTNGPATNVFNTIIVTNLTVVSNVTYQAISTTNIVIGGWGFIITNANPVATFVPYWPETLLVNTTTSALFIWDAGTATWIAINPALAAGLYAVPSVVELRLIEDNGLLNQAHTWGNVAAGDGQGRHYWWNASDTTADDGISVIKPDLTAVGDPGRWNEE